MGTGQTILTIGALMLLSYSVLTFNRTISNVDISLLNNKYRQEALSKLNEFAEDAKRHFFDEVTLDTTSSKILSDLTQAHNLGLEGSDYGVIDDFDDYHELTISDTVRSGMPVALMFEVEYVEVSGANLIKSNTQQYHKRMRIRICDDYPEPFLIREKNGLTVRDTLEISFIQSYWFYN